MPTESVGRLLDNLYSWSKPANDVPFGICTGLHSDENIQVQVHPGNFHRLVLLDDEDMVQTEVKCAGDAPETRVGTCDNLHLKKVWKCDSPTVPFGTLQHQLAEALLSPVTAKCSAKPVSVLILGLGGGALDTYLRAQCPDAEVVNVDSNASVIEAARNFFGFSGTALQMDAATALRSFARKGKIFDAVVIDINGSQLEDTNAVDLEKVLADDGTVAQNTYWFDKENMKSQVEMFKHHLDGVSQKKVGYNTLLTGSKKAHRPHHEHQDQHTATRSAHKVGSGSLSKKGAVFL